MYSLNIRCSATAADITFDYCEVHCCSFCTTAPQTFSGKRVCKRCCSLRSRVKQRRFGGHSLTSFTFHFGHAQLSRTRKDGSVETVQSVTFPTPAPTPKLIQCKHCEATFQNEQVLGAPENATPASKRARRTRLLKSMKNGESVAMCPWEGVGLGRCWLARLGTGPAGATVFQLQPKQRLLNDGSAATMTSLMVALAPNNAGVHQQGARSSHREATAIPEATARYI